MARGGKRVGTPGTPYPNRADLRAPAPAPPTAPTGLPYGEHKQLINAQRAVPAGPAPTPQGQAPQGPPIVQPGSLPWMHPTARPNEPVQAGLASGPGPGPEALRGVGQNLGQNNPDTTKALLANLAASPNAPSSVKELSSIANTGRQ